MRPPPSRSTVATFLIELRSDDSFGLSGDYNIRQMAVDDVAVW